MAKTKKYYADTQEGMLVVAAADFAFYESNDENKPRFDVIVKDGRSVRNTSILFDYNGEAMRYTHKKISLPSIADYQEMVAIDKVIKHPEMQTQEFLRQRNDAYEAAGGFFEDVTPSSTGPKVIVDQQFFDTLCTMMMSKRVDLDLAISTTIQLLEQLKKKENATFKDFFEIMESQLIFRDIDSYMKSRESEESAMNQPV
jgi:hypothetical protein